MNPWIVWILVAVLTIWCFAVLETIAFAAPWMYVVTKTIMMACNFVIQFACIVNIMKGSK